MFVIHLFVKRLSKNPFILLLKKMQMKNLWFALLLFMFLGKTVAQNSRLNPEQERTYLLKNVEKVPSLRCRAFDEVVKSCFLS